MLENLPSFLPFAAAVWAQQVRVNPKCDVTRYIHWTDNYQVSSKNQALF